jgi:RNA binding exosome subunit
MANPSQLSGDDIFRDTFETTSTLPVGGASYIHSPDSIGSLTPTARAIMDELKDWHKRVQKHGSKEIHPSYLLTLDKIPESLNKYSSLSTQAKSEPAIHIAIKQITDFDKRGQHRVGYIYPFLVRTGNKITSKIAIIAPQRESKTDVLPYRQACIRASQELIDMILTHRAKKIRAVDEDNPGAFLFAKTKNEELWLFPKLASLDSEITHLVRKGFGNIPPLPIPEFTEDFLNYAKESNAVISILPDYHVIVDELELNEDGSFKRQPEIINQYRAQVDGLEKFAMEHLRKLTDEQKYYQFNDQLNRFHATHIVDAPFGRKQNSEKANALIELVESFPFEKSTSQYAKRVKETIDLSVRIIKRLLVEKDLILDRKDDSLYIKMRKDILDRIPEFTKNNNTLLKLNFESEVEKLGIKDEKRIHELSKRLKEDVFAKFSYHESSLEDGSTEYYVVDHGYMAAVLHKFTSQAPIHPEMKKQLDIAKTINEKLSNPKHPELNSKLRPEIMVKLSSDIREMERQYQEKVKSAEFQKKINLPAGILAFVASILIFLIGSYNFQSLIPIVFGVPFSVVVGVMAAYFFREKSREELREEILSSGKFAISDPSFVSQGYQGPVSGGGIFGSSSGDSKSSGWFGGSGGGKSGSSPQDIMVDGSEEKKEAKIQDIYRAADGLIFPKKFNKVTDKVLDLKTMRKKIYASLKDIRRRNLTLGKEKDDDKVASTVEFALVQSASIIAIPDDIAIRNFPNQLYILKNDLKSPLFREQLADHYREEMNKKKFDKKLVKYYTFLINTVEMEYYKYLPKKKL